MSDDVRKARPLKAPAKQNTPMPAKSKRAPEPLPDPEIDDDELEDEDDDEEDGDEELVEQSPARVRAAIPPLAVATKNAPLDEGLVTRIWLGGAALSIVTTIAVGWVFGHASGVLVLAVSAFIAVVSLFWSSLRMLLGETGLTSQDAVALGSPRAEEEQKRAVLRALKDLEFERSVGKISDADYRELVVRYREEAKRLLRQLDQSAAEDRARAEAVFRARFGLSANPSVSAPVAETTAKEKAPAELEDAVNEEDSPSQPSPEPPAASAGAKRGEDTHE